MKTALRSWGSCAAKGLPSAFPGPDRDMTGERCMAGGLAGPETEDAELVSLCKGGQGSIWGPTSKIAPCCESNASDDGDFWARRG